MNPQANVVNVGATDPELSTKFYEGLGWRSQQGPDGCVQFQLGPSTLALWEWESLAAQAGGSRTSTGFRGWTLSAIFESAAEVDAIMAAATLGGATVTKPARSAVWGGYSGYFADRDGHFWKIVSNNKPPRGRQRREEEAARVKAKPDMAPAEIAVTLGVEDVKATKHFYSDGLGCPVDKSFGGKFASFNLGDGSAILALYTREGLAKDAGVPVGGRGFPGMMLSTVAASKDDAVATIYRAERAGAKTAVPAGRIKTGGYHASFSDPNGFVWNVATAS